MQHETRNQPRDQPRNEPKNQPRSQPRATPAEPTAVGRFATAARTLADATRAAGLAVPAFRSPPRVPGATRTLRRYPGGVVVSVRLRERPFDEVVADLVEGVVAANGLTGDAALRARTALAAAVTGTSADAGWTPLPGPGAGGGAPAGLASPEVRVVERQTRAA